MKHLAIFSVIAACVLGLCSTAVAAGVVVRGSGDVVCADYDNVDGPAFRCTTKANSPTFARASQPCPDCTVPTGQFITNLEGGCGQQAKFPNAFEGKSLTVMCVGGYLTVNKNVSPAVALCSPMAKVPANCN